jgi:ketosteroid isomerase-like protein
MAAYAPDILAFDAIAQLQFKGAEAYRKHWQMCVEMCSGPMTFEIHDLGIEAGDNVGFAHYLLRCGGPGPDGKEQTGWMRVTVCCRGPAADGRSRTSISRCRSTWKAARRCSASSRSRGILAAWPAGAAGHASRARRAPAPGGARMSGGQQEIAGRAAARHVVAGNYLLAQGRGRARSGARGG